MEKKFQRVGIVARRDTPAVIGALHVLIAELEKCDVKMVCEARTATLFKVPKTLAIVATNALAKHCDLLMVVGGDGSMLHIAKEAALQNLPVLGVNRGRLGFLTDINPDKISNIATILQGNYVEEKRSLLAITICAANKIIATDLVLNDMVLSAGTAEKLIEFGISINGDNVCSYRADGLIVATPTGSTAYALSGGGPILHPQLDAIVIVPMFSHNLSSRPIVIKAESKLQIHLALQNKTDLALCCDGKESLRVPFDGVINISQANHNLKLIHPLYYNYFATLRSKLHWENSL